MSSETRERIPELSTAVASTLRAGLSETADRWIRAPLPYDWPVESALEELAGSGLLERVGVTAPFSEISLPPEDVLVTNDPSEITRWRNQTVSAKAERPTVVLGEARDSKEEGLREPQTVVRSDEVIARWEHEIVAWFKENVSSTAPQAFVHALFRRVKSQVINPIKVDSYLSAIATKDNERSILDTLRSEMWRLGLFPDKQVLDKDQVDKRLRRNIDTIGLLLSPVDSNADSRRRRKLSKLSRSGNPVASAALKYVESEDPAALRHVELSSVEAIIDPSDPGEDDDDDDESETKTIGLFEFLDNRFGLPRNRVMEVIDELGEQWEEAEKSESAASVAIGLSHGEDAYEVQVEFEATEPESDDLNWLGDGSPEKQNVVFRAAWDINVGDSFVASKKLTGRELLKLAESQDALSGEESEVGAYVEQYVDARSRLADWEKWIYRQPFELLLLSGDARVAASDFLDAWYDLVEAVGRRSGKGLEVLRDTVVRSEAAWIEDEEGGEYEECLLSPVHPFRLEPVMELVSYCRESAGESRVGEKLEWALERSVPAYRGIWAPNNDMLYLRDEGEFLVYEAGNDTESRPAANRGTGLYQICNSYTGYHPYARDALVVTLVNPPVGGAISGDLRRLDNHNNHVKELRVYEVTTSGKTSDLSSELSFVSHLGRFESVSEWLDERPVRSHLVVLFSRRPAENESAKQEHSGPSKGAHVALEFDVRKTTFEDPTPFVTFRPRSSNRSVVSLQRLAAPARGSVKVVEADPTLKKGDRDEVVSLREFTDWLVIGSPGPLGMVAPRILGEGLRYIGREALGVYSLFTYSSDVYSVRRLMEKELADKPIPGEVEELERQITNLAIDSPNGVLRIGRKGSSTEQIGLLMASRLAREEGRDD